MFTGSYMIYSFIAHLITVVKLLEVNNDILDSLDEGCVSVLIMLDLSAAFDTIDHQTLLERLERHYGIRSIPRAWMTSYLSERSI